MKGAIATRALGALMAVVAATAALGLAANRTDSTMPERRVTSLGTQSANLYVQLDSAQGSVLPPEMAGTLTKANGIDTDAAVLGATEGPFRFYLVRSTEAGHVCWVAFHNNTPLSLACGPRRNIVDGRSMSLVVPETTTPSSGFKEGFDFLVVPDGFDQVIGPLETTTVRNNVAIVPRASVGGAEEARSFRRAEGGDIVRVAS